MARRAPEEVFLAWVTEHGTPLHTIAYEVELAACDIRDGYIRPGRNAYTVALRRIQGKETRNV